MRFRLLVLVMASACASKPRVTPWADVRGTPDKTSLRHVAQGDIVGFADSPSTFAWLGVPYAAPPVGPLRWRPPSAPSPWSASAREATRYGSMCPQFSLRLAGGKEGEVVGDEDCLTLNISAPQQPSTEKRAVMVWVHGGGNSIGTANTYGIMRNLAATQGVVVVSVNYRLGLLGWFHHAAIVGSDASAEERSGNYGTLDLISALRWVNENIAAFGGDPGNITVFGESAGGFNIFSLLTSPLARGLFHKAIVQSGIPSTNTVAEAENFTDAPEPGMRASSGEMLLKYLMADGKAADRASAKAVLGAMKGPEIDSYLRAKTPQQLLAPLKGAGFGMYQAPALLRDGTVLPISSVTDVLADPARENHVPVLLGTNRDEWKLFMAFNELYVGKTLGLFPFIRDQAAYDRDAALVSDAWKWLGTDRPARALTQSQGNSVFAYRFDWDEEPSRAGVDVSKLLGAAHGLEMNFVFGDVAGVFGIVSDDNRAGRAEVANAMSSYWATFAKNGVPGRGGQEHLPEWAPYGEGQFMTFDSSAGGGVRLQTGAQSGEGLEQRIWSDLTMTEARRCRMFVWLFAGFAKASGGWSADRETSFRTHCPNDTTEALLAEPR